MATKEAIKEVATRSRIKHRSRPTVAEGGPHPVDVHVGGRVRLARLLAGRTQEWLGSQVGLTFQQIQKYERGANRVSCSMLSEFATALDRPVAWFFQENPSDVNEKAAAPDLRTHQQLRQDPQ
jgi:transcriptional regulator with XRE-family HTH domain